MELIIRALAGILPNFSAFWVGLMGFEVAGVPVVGRGRKKLMFNPHRIYNSQTSNPVKQNVKFWLKANI
jgi:hypothetical protein